MKCSIETCKRQSFRGLKYCFYCLQEATIERTKDTYELSVDKFRITGCKNSSKVNLSIVENNIEKVLFQVDFAQANAISLAIKSVSTCVEFDK